VNFPFKREKKDPKIPCLSALNVRFAEGPHKKKGVVRSHNTGPSKKEKRGKGRLSSQAGGQKKGKKGG